MTRRLPSSAHTDRPWRIHDVAGGFRLEDVWALPTPGGPDDFPRLVALLAALDPVAEASGVAGLLWRVRARAGAVLGLDDPPSAGSAGAEPPTLRDRLPADLLAVPRGPRFDDVPFRSVYLLDDEWVAEAANGLVHGLLHVGWVPDGRGGFRGQLAVLVRPAGRVGAAYMAAIAPFRHRVIYPALLGDLERRWAAGAVPEPLVAA